MLKKPLLLLCGAALSFSALAQNKLCGNDAKNPHYHRALGSTPQFEAWLAKESKNLRIEDNDEVYVVPTIYHIIHEGEAVGTGSNLPYAQVISQNKVLNEDYSRLNPDTTNTPAIFKARAAALRIEFRLAEIAPDGTRLAEPGVMRHDLSKFGRNLDATKLTTHQIDSLIGIPITREWLPANYLNHLIVPSIIAPGFEPGKEPTPLLGYAYFPNDSGLGGDEPFSPDDPTPLAFEVTVKSGFGSNFTGDGTFDLGESNNRGKTVTHEVGHFFALLHVWGNGSSSQDNNCLGTDYCDDTPTVRFSNEAHGSDCGVVPTKTQCPNAEQPMIQNYMDYGDDACQNLFTRDQKTRARTVMEKSKNRRELPFSNTIRPHYVPQDLRAESTSSGIRLTWTDRSKNAENYIIEKSVGTADFSVISTLPKNTLSFTDASANLSQQNRYRIRSSNRAGATDNSSIVSVGVLNLAAPVATAATNIEFFAFTANWNAVSGAASYIVEISTSENFTNLSAQTVNTTSARFNNLEHSTNYFYRVRAVTATVQSPNSNTVRVTTTVGLEDLSSSERIAVFPNPTKNFVQIQMENYLANQALEVILFSANGQEIFRAKENLSSINERLKNIELNRGVYILEMKSETYSAKKRFVKE